MHAHGMSEVERCARALRRNPLDPRALETLGRALVGAGRLEEGIELLQRAAAVDPGNTDLRVTVAEVLLRIGRADDAVRTLAAAVDGGGASAVLLYNLGLAQQTAQDAAGAIASYRQCLGLDPAIPEAHNNLGTLLESGGELQQSLWHFREAVRLRPDYRPALTNLGNALRKDGKPAEAVALLQQALLQRPDHAAALSNLGDALADLERLEEAEAHLRRALSFAPSLAEAHLGLGRVLLRRGERAEALSSFQRAQALKPTLVDAVFALAQLAREDGRLAEAAEHFARVCALEPRRVEARVLRGYVLLLDEKWQAAIDALDQAIAIDPTHVPAYLPRGAVLMVLERYAEAAATLERAAALEPENLETSCALLGCYSKMCDWPRVEEHLRQIADRPGAIEYLHKYALLGESDDPADQLRAARSQAGRVMRNRTQLPNAWPYRHDRIRVAYLSSDFRVHATSFLIAELFELHDRGAFHVTGVSYGPDDHSKMRARVGRACDAFVDVSSAAHRDVAQWLVAQETDIVIDLKGYTALARPEILAYRPAPIQVNYLGYPCTMGASFVDYLIADEFLIPPADRGFYDEKVVYLPDSYQANDRQREISATTLTRAAAGLPPQGFVFCSFNNLWKINAPVFDVWMRLLAGVPDSVLWLLEGNPWAADNLRREAGARGIAAERLIFGKRLANAEHLARQRLADLCLDTLPINAHTTASDALWAGLPVLTCAGRTFAARVAGSLLRAVGLAGLVTSSLAEYEQLALSLARDPQRLRALRARLAADRERLPLFDTPRFARNLEALYRHMWLRHQRGEPAASFKVEGNTQVVDLP